MTQESENGFDKALVVMKTATEVIAGALKSDKGDLVITIGRLLAGLRGRFPELLMHEFKRLKEKGKVKDDYYDTEQFKTGFQELFDAIENDPIDENVFNAMKRIFLVALTEQMSDRFDPLPLEYLRLCRTLSPGAILLMYANYKIIQGGKFVILKKSLHLWIEKVQENSDLKHKDLILLHEQELVDRHILRERLHSDRSGVGLDDVTYRLTDLGYSICEYIQYFDELDLNDNGVES